MSARLFPAPSIQSSPHPLAFRVAHPAALPDAQAGRTDRIAIRTVARALEGMQKEALIKNGLSGAAWRVVCDEGPYLNGTDLAPFPLAFFAAGMAATLGCELLALARRRAISVENLRITQDTRYALEGSAIKRTMKGEALPIETEVGFSSSAARERCAELVYHALAASPADAVMRGALPSVFSLVRNGDSVSTRTPSASEAAADPAPLFEHIAPAAPDTFAPGIIRKLEAHVPEPATASRPAIGYAAEQKRTIHIRATLVLREDGLKAIEIRMFRPPASVFGFLADDSLAFGGRGRAPDGLEWLSAGVAFCYMTQIGRYAAITKQRLHEYRIAQDTVFSLPGGSAGLATAASAEPVDTRVFIRSDDDEDTARTLVEMSEQTCYLHASYRDPVKTRLRLAF
jgi:uncharacterized OsmC-like protein